MISSAAAMDSSKRTGPALVRGAPMRYWRPGMVRMRRGVRALRSKVGESTALEAGIDPVRALTRPHHRPSLMIPGDVGKLGGFSRDGQWGGGPAIVKSLAERVVGSMT